MAPRVVQRRQALVERVLGGPGEADRGARRAAFDNDARPGPMRALVQKIARAAASVSDEDVALAKSGGVAEDEIFELSICAALGEASRQLGSALAALDAATSNAQAKDPK